MFDFDVSKMMLVGVLALILLGPKELPRVMRQLGQAIGKMRRMAGEFQGQFMDAMREAELDDIRKEVSKIGESAKIDLPSVDPVGELRRAAEGGPSPTNAGQALESMTVQSQTPDPTAGLAQSAPLDIAPPPPMPAVTSETIAADMAREDAARAQIAATEAVNHAPAPAQTAEAADAPRRRSARPAGA
jgi:sec-independent protein translocase protein TatB